MRTARSHFITRSRVAQGPNGPRIASMSVSQIICHPRVMCRSLPHLTLTASTSSLSPTSPIFQLFFPSQSVLWYLIHYPATIHSGVADPQKSHLPQVLLPSVCVAQRNQHLQKVTKLVLAAPLAKAGDECKVEHRKR